MGRAISFVTSNEHKFKEAESVLKSCGINIRHIRLRYDEARADKCEEVALKSAEECFARIRKPLFVEDSGLFVSSLNGFPGTYSAWVFKKIGNEGLLKLLENEKNRGAKFVSSVAYADGNGVRAFTGEVKGKIALRIRGKRGFGYDPAFIPENWEKTYGESDEAKAETSHRKRSLTAFVNWLKKNRK